MGIDVYLNLSAQTLVVIVVMYFTNKLYREGERAVAHTVIIKWIWFSKYKKTIHNVNFLIVRLFASKAGNAGSFRFTTTFDTRTISDTELSVIIYIPYTKIKKHVYIS